MGNNKNKKPSRPTSNQATRTSRSSASLVTPLSNGTLVLGLVVIFGLGMVIRIHNMEAMAPTFDEPFHVLQGVNFMQYGVRFWPDLHPALFEWLIGRVARFVADFENVQAFTNNADVYTGPYHYRLDLFSHLPEDFVLLRFRYIFQAFYFMTVGSCLWIAKKCNFSVPSLLAILAFLLLEPALVGITTILGNDMVVVAFAAMGTALALYEGGLFTALALLLFSAAWATKWTTSLWCVPLLIGFVTKKFPKRILVLWGLGAIGGYLLSLGISGLPTVTSQLTHPSFRMTYLDGVTKTTPFSFYFLQGLLCKSSLAVLVALGVTIHSWYAGRRSLVGLTVCVILIGSLMLSSQILPGIGVRLILPITVSLLVLLAYSIDTPKKLGIIVALLLLECGLNYDALLAYQNPLAGSELRLMDSNTDMGQGLKSLAQWRRTHLDQPLAIANFGGTPPETYGLTDYVPMDSFPMLKSKETLLEGGNYTGYIAVSRNFLVGYIVSKPSLQSLTQFSPVICFQNAMCVYDSRTFK